MNEAIRSDQVVVDSKACDKFLHAYGCRSIDFDRVDPRKHLYVLWDPVTDKFVI